uniref:RRM domain-containing protein n=1 Tax=Araucaria cunninghamii TaxID=56994 RepID=A0A0D6R503_ARACU
MDSDQGKLFVGGISWDTTEETLRDYFRRYGEVADAVIMRDRSTGNARGFGFVVFADPSVADRVVHDRHVIAGRTVETKKAVPKSDQLAQQQSQGFRGARGVNLGVPEFQRSKKIFVGGLTATVTEEEFRRYFEQFGKIMDVVVMYDSGTQRPRGFGFITFDSEAAVDAVLQKSFHELHDKMVEVKRAIPKEAQGGASGGGRGRGFGGGGGRQGRMESTFGGPAPAGRGYGRYGPTGYGAPAVPGGFVGGYMNGAYGRAAGGFGYGSMPPTAAAAAPPPGGLGSAYGNGPAPGLRDPWNSAPGPTGPNYAANSAAAHGPPGGGQGPGYGGAPVPASASAYGYGDKGYGSGGPRSVGFGGAPAVAPYGGYGDSRGAPGYSDAAWNPGGGGGAPGSYGGGDVAYAGGGYGAAGRQNQRGPDARFKPYPDRTG